MTSVKELINSLIPKNETWKLQLLSEWQSIVGNLKTGVILEKIYDDTLILGVDNSSWMQELYLLTPVLIGMINTRIDQPRIKTIRFRLTINKRRTIKYCNSQKSLPSNPLVHAISNKEEQALAAIQDTQLRDALYQFLMRCYQERI